jgi:hypothetical protein
MPRLGIKPGILSVFICFCHSATEPMRLPTLKILSSSSRTLNYRGLYYKQCYNNELTTLYIANEEACSINMITIVIDNSINMITIVIDNYIKYYNCNLQLCKHFTIVNDTSRAMLQIVASL